MKKITEKDYYSEKKNTAVYRLCMVSWLNKHKKVLRMNYSKIVYKEAKIHKDIIIRKSKT